MADLIHINDTLTIPVEELEFQAIRAQGPGGQNVNKVATAIQLRFDAENSPSLPDDVRTRLLSRSDHRISEDGTVMIKAQRFRSQARNREDAIRRLVELIRKALEVPKARKVTRPGKAIRKKRLDAKRRRGDIKSARRPPRDY